MQSTKPNSLVDSARSVANKYDDMCRTESGATRRILLVRGLEPALRVRSKSADYQEDTANLCDMVFASLMIDENIVVIEAVRKKQEETTMIMRQLALACYHYQLLTNE